MCFAINNYKRLQLYFIEANEFLLSSVVTSNFQLIHRIDKENALFIACLETGIRWKQSRIRIEFYALDALSQPTQLQQKPSSSNTKFRFVYIRR